MKMLKTWSVGNKLKKYGILLSEKHMNSDCVVLVVNYASRLKCLKTYFLLNHLVTTISMNSYVSVMTCVSAVTVLLITIVQSADQQQQNTPKKHTIGCIFSGSKFWEREGKNLSNCQECKDGLVVECWTCDRKVLGFTLRCSRWCGRIFFSRVNFLCWLLF